MLGLNQLRSGNAGVPDVSVYDFVLAVLPLPLVVGLLVGRIVDVPPHVTVAAGAGLSALALGHVLFVNPPVDRGPRGRTGGPSA